VEFIFLIIVIVLITLAVTARQSRSQDQQPRMHVCQNCSLTHPTFASYCRRCGTRL
jgi:ribosomal protein L40E